MWLALIIAIGSVAAGAWLALSPLRGRARLAPVQTFALVAVLTVVLGHLLPDALEALGFPGLFVFSGAFMLPTAFERFFIWRARLRAEADTGAGEHIALRLGYLGLVLHKLGDGFALGTFSGPVHAGHAHADVLLAVAVHTVPVTALVALAVAESAGRRAAVVHVVGLALATAVGVVLSHGVPLQTVRSYEPWLTAIVAGLILHVVVHDWRPRSTPNRLTRSLDLLAIGAGLSLMFVGGHSHHGSEPTTNDVRHRLGQALVELLLETAPTLLFGLAIASVLQTLGSRIPARWLGGGTHVGQAARGALLGLPLPVCACGILPVADALRRRGAGPALVVAFLLATPELGVETFALTVRFLGWPFAWFRLLGALAVATVAALLVSRGVGPGAAGPSDSAQDSPFQSEPDTQPAWSRILGHFDELLYHIGAWTLVGLLAAAYLQAVVPSGALAGIGAGGLDMLIVSLLAVPSYVCASSATPLAAVLLSKGMSPGAVLVGLLLGPATNLATVASLSRWFGHRAAWAGLVGLLLTAWAFGLVVNHVPLAALDSGQPVTAHSHGTLAYGSVLVLAVFVLRRVWQGGLRAWFASVGESLASPHSHAHGHGNGHRH